MLVYRHPRRMLEPAVALAELERRAVALPPDATLGDVRDLLIDAGVVEAGVGDTLLNDADGPEPAVDAVRVATRGAGRWLVARWSNDADAAGAAAATLATAVARARALALALPTAVEVTDPEGYAYWGLYPESYIHAAELARARHGITAAVCVGIRSIGTGLSAVVEAALAAAGVEVWSTTVRPRGHPYDRAVRLAPALAARLCERRDHHALVVDEGPGLSGSSFAAVARALSALGFSDDRIILLPSWRTDGATLRSEAARAAWRRHPQVVVSFEETWLDGDRLSVGPAALLEDVSAGVWRERLLPRHDAVPAAHPQHERRKYLAWRSGGFGHAVHMAKFVGLGARGRLAEARALAMAADGFGPEGPVLRDGFLCYPLVPGLPVARAPADPALIAHVARYLAWIAAESPAEPAPLEALRRMTLHNTEDALGKAAARRLRARLPSLEALGAGRFAWLDGRQLPQEWLRSPAGFCKVDATDHGDDDFFPGPADIAWDLAAAALELAPDLDARRALVARYRALSGDRGIERRLPAWAAAYLAWRIGYTTLAAETLGASPDGARFARERERYVALLRAELADAGRHRWAA